LSTVAAAHGVVQSLAPYPGEQRVALLPSVVRMLLATFLEEVASADGACHVTGRDHRASGLRLFPTYASRRSAHRVADAKSSSR
jgi:hypothetical protein